MKNMQERQQQKDELLALIGKTAQNRDLLDRFLTDLLTPREYEELAARWQIVKQLDRGVPQRKIARNLRVAIATITRGARELLDPEGGFNKVLRKYYATR